MNDFDFPDGYVQRKKDGSFGGAIKIEGIDLSPIDAVYFKKNGGCYLWLKRRHELKYDARTQSFTKCERKPYFECYLKKQIEDGTVAYSGEFIFMRFVFRAVGVWDKVLGLERNNRLNIFVERLPMSQQTIINNIKERKRKK